MKLASHLFLFFALNLICLIIEDPGLRLWMASGIGIVQTVLLLLATKEFNPLNLFSLAMILWMAQFPLAGFLIQASNLPLNYGVNIYYLSLATILANVCQLVVAVVWRLPIWTRIALRTPRPDFPVLSKTTGALGILWLISLLIRFLSLFLGYQPGLEVEAGALTVSTNLIYIVINFVNLMPTLYFCGLLKRGGRYAKLAASLVVVVESVIMTFFTGTKAGPLIILINFAVAYHYVVRPIRVRKTWALMAFVAIVILPFYVIKSNVRMTHLSTYELKLDRPKLGIEDFLWLYSEAALAMTNADMIEILQETSTALVYRLDNLSVLAATLSYYDQQKSFETSMYLPMWIKPYIPRFIWPEKGWGSLGLFVSDVILGIPTYTHAAVTSTIEGYIAGGTLGALILACIHGAFVSFAYAYLTVPRGKTDNSFLKAYFVSMFLVFLYFNSSVTFPRTVFTNMVFLWLLVNLLHWCGKVFRQKIYIASIPPSFSTQEKL